MARDRPSPYGKRGVLDTVARGPVPRDRPSLKQDLHDFHDFQDKRAAASSCVAWRGTGPRPTVKGGVLRAARDHLRSGDRKLQRTVARGPVPRERSRAPETVVRDRLIPNGSSARPPHLPERGGLSPASAAWRGTGPRPTVIEAVPDTVARGPVPRERFRLRSAGARRSRSVHGEGNPLACTCGIRGPKPYGVGGRSFHRSAGDGISAT